MANQTIVTSQSTGGLTTSSSSSTIVTNPVSALMAGRATLAAPPSLSTVNHSDNVANNSNRVRDRLQRSNSRSVQVSYRPDLQQALSPPTAAVPISTRENISTSKNWFTPTTQPKSQGATTSPVVPQEPFAVHPTFRKDAENCGDVLVRVEGIEFYVHKHVLLFSSPFFASILEGEWKESRLSAYIESSDTASEAPDPLEPPTAQLHSEDDSTTPSLPQPEHFVLPTQQSETASAPDSPHHDLPLTSPVSEFNSDDASALLGQDESRGLKDARHSSVRASYYTARFSFDDEDVISSSPSSSDHSRDQNLAASQRALEGRPHTSDETSTKQGGVGLEPLTSSTASRRRSASVGSARDKSGRSHKPKSRSMAHREPPIVLSQEAASQMIPARKSSKTFNAVVIGENDSVRQHDSEPSSPLARFVSLATPPGSPAVPGFFQRHHDVTVSTPKALASSRLDDPSTVKPSRSRSSKSDRARNTKSALGNMIAVIDLEEETATTFHDFLFHIYPHLDLAVTWFNCGPLLRFADKFQVPYMRRCCVTFLRAALAGRPIEAMRLAELHRLDDLYKEASRHVLDNFAAWEPEELECLSKETLLKLERKRTWFLERMLKLGLCSPARDYECHANCPDPQACAKALQDRWQTAYANAFRFSPPQPSAIFRHLRELDGGPLLPMSACQSTARAWVQLLFDRMFSLGTLHTPRQFLSIKLDSQVPRNTGFEEV